MTIGERTITIAPAKLASYRDKETTTIGNRFGEAIRAGLAQVDPDDEAGLEALAVALSDEIAPMVESAIRRAIAAALEG